MFNKYFLWSAGVVGLQCEKKDLRPYHGQTGAGDVTALTVPNHVQATVLRFISRVARARGGVIEAIGATNRMATNRMA